MNSLITVKNDSPNENTRFDVRYFPQSNELTNALGRMFPEQMHEDKIVEKSKEILGSNYTSEEIKTLIASFEYLITNWLETYERKVFNKKSLKELLQSF